MSCAFSSFPKHSDHFRRIALRARAPVQYKNFHRVSSFFSIPVMLLTTIQISDLCHLIVSQLKTEQIEVFP